MWYNKDQICETDGKRVSRSKGAGILDTVASTGVDLLIQNGIPWLGHKAVEMGRYYGSEALRNPKLQKKAIDFALDKLNPMIQIVGSQALDELSTKIRPQKNYKTNRKNLDGAGLDIQKHLSKLGELHMRTPTLKKYNYCGPGTKLEERLASNDPKIRDPINNLDSICQRHDIAYSKAQSLKDKHIADDVMLDEIAKMPYKDRPWGTTAVQAMIAGKRKLGPGVKQRKSKNVKSRRVKKTGKKN